MHEFWIKMQPCLLMLDFFLNAGGSITIYVLIWHLNLLFVFWCNFQTLLSFIIFLLSWTHEHERLWKFNVSVDLKPALHSSHLYSLTNRAFEKSKPFLHVCIWESISWEKDFWQIKHVNGFFPSWIDSVCKIKSLLNSKALSQFLQL